MFTEHILCLVCLSLAHCKFYNYFRSVSHCWGVYLKSGHNLMSQYPCREPRELAYDGSVV